MIRIGCGSAFDEDRLDWPVELAQSGRVEYMGFDGLAERSIALAHVRRQQDDRVGHDLRLDDVVDAFAPSLRRGLRMVGNWGAANPEAGADTVMDAMRRNDLTGTRVGVIFGDDVRQQVLAADVELPELSCQISDIAEDVVAANAYIGAEPIVSLLERGAQFIIGGRIADPSLFVAPICHELDWALDDWDRVAQATAAGHLLECGVHLTGGVFADPPRQHTPDLTHLSFPLAEVSNDEMIVTKLDNTGGLVSERTVKVQLAYEVHDPASYLTPDVAADFSDAEVRGVGPDRVRVDGVVGRARPETLKVLVGLDLGWKSVFDLSFGGPSCVERARLAQDVLRSRIHHLTDAIDEIRVDLVGFDSLFGSAVAGGYPREVRLRIASRARDKAVAAEVLRECRYLTLSTAAGGGGAGAKVLSPMIGVTSAYLPRGDVHIETELREA